MNIIVTSDKNEFKDAIKQYVFTYILTFDCMSREIEELKTWLKKNNYGNRVYIYNY
jgi:hypothetical protein